ncbi:hypothetical protein BHM03_00061002 [Ensete ventricosum]|nr:hypothetical protein BHM03_00061002 [Ensete ventricosum]
MKCPSLSAPVPFICAQSTSPSPASCVSESSAMPSPKKLIKTVRKWQKVAGLGRTRRRIMTGKPDDSAAEWCSAPLVARRGHVFVYTADGKRFTVPLKYLSSRIFRELLRMSEEEFGLPTDGPITVPCEAASMDYIIALLRGGITSGVEKAVLASIAGRRCTVSAFIRVSFREEKGAKIGRSLRLCAIDLALVAWAHCWVSCRKSVDRRPGGRRASTGFAAASMAIAGALSPTAMSPGISEDRRQREGCAPPGTAAANMGIVETLRTTAAPAARASATVAPVAVSPTRSADRRQRERCAPTGSAAANTATAEPRRTTAVPAARANAPTHSLDISIKRVCIHLNFSDALWVKLLGCSFMRFSDPFAASHVT